MKHLMRSEVRGKYLRDIVLESVTVRQLPAKGSPEHFFEVELRGIIRHRNDQLLDVTAINAYLAQVGPVPFAPNFCFGQAISSALQAHVNLGEIEITLPDESDVTFNSCHRCEHRWWESASGVIDLNAVPPLGIEGVSATDKGTDRGGMRAWGAPGVGGTKMKIHKKAIQELFTANDKVLDAEEILEIGRSLG